MFHFNEDLYLTHSKSKVVDGQDMISHFDNYVMTIESAVYNATDRTISVKLLSPQATVTFSEFNKENSAGVPMSEQGTAQFDGTKWILQTNI